MNALEFKFNTTSARQVDLGEIKPFTLGEYVETRKYIPLDLSSPTVITARMPVSKPMPMYATLDLPVCDEDEDGNFSLTLAALLGI